MFVLQSELSLLEQVKSGKIWDFPGGIHPPERKHLSNTGEISIAPLAKQLYIPLKQHIGNAGKLLVSEGDKVLKGQALTKPSEGFSLPVHAPTSGCITAITDHVSAHPSGILEPTLVIEPDGLEQWIEKSPIANWQDVTTEQLSQQFQKMGIAGLGGATFPTYVKTSTKAQIELLIINAVECEPYITADDMLMQHHAEDILLGINILKHTVSAKLAIIAIEDNKPQAIANIKKALAGRDDIELRVVPTKYPSGGEKQLIQLITNQQVPNKGIPADLGIVMLNVGTTYAVKKAVIDGEPLIERVVTVTGESITNPQNMWVKLGTPVQDLINHVGIVPDKNQRLIMGGPMMGFSIMSGLMPVVKATNCILAPSQYHLPPLGQEQACIRCGDCASVCPAELLPQQMLWYSKANDHDKLNEYNLFDCIECGACAYVCPSQIPLVQYYRSSKVEVKQAQQDKIKSDKAKIRFEQRQERLEREKQARLKRHEEAAQRRKKAMANDDSAKDKIAAALARAKAKKAQQGAPQEAPQDGAPEQQTSQAPIDKVAAAIARAKAKKAAQNNESVNSERHQSPTPPKVLTETQPEDRTPEQIKKDKVAQALARAKAKREAKQAEQTQQIPQESTETPPVNPEEKSAEQIKKEKVAAAIAKAKARKAKQQAEGNKE